MTASVSQPLATCLRTRAARRVSRVVAPVLAGVVLLLVGAVSGQAQERYSYTVAVSPTVGGSVSGGIDKNGFQANFSWRTQPRTAVGIRLGSIGLSGEQVGTMFGPDFRYATIAGEYKFQEIYYQSGVFFGLGLYQLGNGTESEQGPGMTLGVSGDFPINERLSFVVELSGHYADIDAASTFGGIHLGLAYHF